jgi:hypothetical protein
VTDTSGPIGQGLHYHVLPKDDPVAALNILRQAAGLEPLSSPDHSETRGCRRRHAIQSEGQA